MVSARASAITTRIGSSRRNEPRCLRLVLASARADLPPSGPLPPCSPRSPRSAAGDFPVFPCCWSGPAAVVQLGPADPALGDNLDLVDGRAVHREGALHADAIADLTHRECLPGAAALAADDHALEDLDPRAVALLHADVHLQRVPGTESRDVPADLSLLQVGDRGVHGVVPR